MTGNKIRIHPNGVLFNSPRADQDIYSHKSNVMKSKAYIAFQRNSMNANTLNSIDVPLHAKKRKQMNLIFSEKSLRSAGGFIIKHVNRWIELLTTGDGTDWSEPRNMTEWTDTLVFDILGDLCFGRSFEIKESGPNPFKVIPHAIVDYVKFMYPVSEGYQFILKRKACAEK